MTKHAPCACYPQGNDGDCPAPGCAVRPQSDDKSERSRVLMALDRMILSVEADMQEEGRRGNQATVTFLAGEAKGYRNARTYIEEDAKRIAPLPELGTSSGCAGGLAVSDDK